MSGPPEKVSDTTHHDRRWWQFWKPRHWTETNIYQVVKGTDSNASSPISPIVAYNDSAWGFICEDDPMTRPSPPVVG